MGMLADGQRGSMILLDRIRVSAERAKIIARVANLCALMQRREPIPNA